MSKAISSGLMADIAAGVTTLAILVTITRDDSTKIHFTSHDTPIKVDNVTFRNDLLFNVSALTANSDLSVDSSELEMAIDGVVITKQDVAQDLYRGGQIEIALVNWKNTEHGTMTIRSGWFTSVVAERPQTLKFEIGGLMKILDMSIGRIYQPSCDATLGDKRCRVAIDLSQAHSKYNLYGVGDWTYVYDRTKMTALTSIVNPGFESEVASASQPITGWTRSDGVNEFGTIGDNALEGSNRLEGRGSDGARYSEAYVMQTIDLIDGGMDATAIDAGTEVFASWIGVRQASDLTDMPRIVVEFVNTAGAVTETIDTRYFNLDAPNVWRDKSIIRELIPGTRAVNLYLYYTKRRASGQNTVSFDKVELFWYSLTDASPYGNVIHKVGRIIAPTNHTYDYSLANPSFEQKSVVNTNVSGAIAGWACTTADWWKVDLNIDGIGGTSPVDGSLLAIGGDNSTGVQSTYNLTTTIAFTATSINATRLAQGFYGGRLFFKTIAGNLTDEGAVSIEFFDADSTSLGAVTALALAVSPVVGATAYETEFFFPNGTVSAVITITTQTTTGTSKSEFGFDAFRLQMFDMDRANENDLLVSVGDGSDGADFDHTGGNYTQDTPLVWKAFASQRGYDTVSSVPSADRKTFVGTDIAGVTGAFVTSPIRWLTGANKGRTNIVRGWDPVTATLKTYFANIDAIQVGDVFQFARACGKGFVTDCVGIFNNGINFQGFPYVPGSISALQQNGGLAGSGTTPPSLPAVKTLTRVHNLPDVGDLTGTGSAGFNIALPTDSVAGDVAIVWARAPAGSVTAFVGFTVGGSVTHTGTHSASIQQFYKILTADDITLGHIVAPVQTSLAAVLSVFHPDSPATALSTASFDGGGTPTAPLKLVLAPQAPPGIAWCFGAPSDTDVPLVNLDDASNGPGTQHRVAGGMDIAYIYQSLNRDGTVNTGLPPARNCGVFHFVGHGTAEFYEVLCGYLLVK